MINVLLVSKTDNLEFWKSKLPKDYNIVTNKSDVYDFVIVDEYFVKHDYDTVLKDCIEKNIEYVIVTDEDENVDNKKYNMSEFVIDKIINSFKFCVN